jgi:TnpA family transposase
LQCFTIICYEICSFIECKKEIPEYCKALGLNDEPNSFVEQLKEDLTKTAKEVDQLYPGNKSLIIESSGKMTLKKYSPKNESKSVKELKDKLFQYIPERSILEILCNTHHWINWTRHFGPISGSDPKIENAIEKYILLSFSYGCNFGPVQASKHFNGVISAHMLSYLNSRHVTIEKLDLALRDIINTYRLLELPTFWGTGKHAAADGTLIELFRNNIVSEYHIRYGRDGGIMFHLLSDTYIALMGTFIPCGAWEAIYLLDLFIKNKSEIQPDTIHGDTQEQSGTVFALSYLLGVNLMPRIRNWQDLTFFRPDKSTTYKHIDSLFKDTIDWDLIKTHWKDIFQVVMSIKQGKILPSTLLKKLNNKSRKNRLFHVFRELGMAVRTKFLLRYIIDMNMRQKITAETNKVESYNGFIDWIRFGGDGIISSNDPVEQEKRAKYAEVVASAIVLHNTVDMTNAINELLKEGHKILKSDVEGTSPYITKSIKRFGEYYMDINIIPEPINPEILLH